MKTQYKISRQLITWNQEKTILNYPKKPKYSPEKGFVPAALAAGLPKYPGS